VHSEYQLFGVDEKGLYCLDQRPLVVFPLLILF